MSGKFPPQVTFKHLPKPLIYFKVSEHYDNFLKYPPFSAQKSQSGGCNPNISDQFVDHWGEITATAKKEASHLTAYNQSE
jgi:hypothetical protein